jgi:hypothetical protein
VHLIGFHYKNVRRDNKECELQMPPIIYLQVSGMKHVTSKSHTVLIKLSLEHAH